MLIKELASEIISTNTSLSVVEKKHLALAIENALRLVYWDGQNTMKARFDALVQKTCDAGCTHVAALLTPTTQVPRQVTEGVRRNFRKKLPRNQMITMETPTSFINEKISGSS